VVNLNCQLELGSESLGNIYIFNKNNNVNIWIDLIHNLTNCKLIFDWLKYIEIDYGNNFNVFIKIPILNTQYKYKQYFNLNSLKLLCENNDFNIIDLYKGNIDELFYIVQIKKKDIVCYNRNFNIYKYIYDEMLLNTYDLDYYI